MRVTVPVLSKAAHLDGCRLRHALGRTSETTAAAAACVVLYMDIFFSPSKMDTLN